MTSLTGWMLYALTVSLLVAAAAWSLEVGLSRVRLPTRWIWACALAASLAIPLVTLVPGPAREVEGTAAGSIQMAIRPGVVRSGQDAVGVGRALLGWPATVSRGTVDALGAALDRAATVIPRGPASSRLVLALWIAWSLAFGLALVIAAVKMARRRGSWPRSVVHGRSVRIAPDLGPAVVGILRPDIILPGWMLVLPREDVDLVLAHEEEHLRARDPLLLGTGLLPLVALPWNPPLWWQLKKLKEAVEVDCDRRVLRRGVPAGAYGSLLVRIGSRSPRWLLPAPALTTSRPILLRRLEAMRRRPGKGRVAVTGLASLLSTGLFVLAVEADTPRLPDPPVTPTATSGIETTVSDERATPAGPDGADVPRTSGQLAAVPASDVPPSPMSQAPVPLPSGSDSGALPAAPAGETPSSATVAMVTSSVVWEPPVLPNPIRLDPEPDLPRQSVTFAAMQESVAPLPPVQARRGLGVGRIAVSEIVQSPPEVSNLLSIEHALLREYPSILKGAGIGGTVGIRMHVTEGGNVSEAVLSHSSGYPLLDTAALRVAESVQFTPAMNGEQAVAIWTELPITFQASY